MGVNEEMTTDFLDIIKRLAKKWKMILIFAVVLAIIVNVAFVVMDRMDSAETEEMMETLKEDIPDVTFGIAEIAKGLIPEDESLNDSKITNVLEELDRYYSYKEELQTIEDKLDESYYLKLDKELVPCLSTQYVITVNASEWETLTKSGLVADIETIIINYLLSDEVLSEIVKSLDSYDDINLFKELISINSVNDIIVIKVMGQSRDECENISGLFRNFIETRASKLDSTLSNVDFNIAYVSDIYNEIDGQFVIEAINEYHDKVVALEKKIDELSGNLESDEKTLYDKILTTEYVRENSSEEDYAKYIEHKDKIIDIKGAVIGFILGAFVYCVYFVIKYLFSKKLKTENDLAAFFGLINCRSEENVRSLMQKKDWSKVAVLGAGKDKISLNGVAVAEADCALLVEEIDVTDMKTVVEEVNECKQYEVPVLGYILVK